MTCVQLLRDLGHSETKPIKSESPGLNLEELLTYVVLQTPGLELPTTGLAFPYSCKHG